MRRGASQTIVFRNGRDPVTVGVRGRRHREWKRRERRERVRRRAGGRQLDRPCLHDSGLVPPRRYRDARRPATAAGAAARSPAGAGSAESWSTGSRSTGSRSAGPGRSSPTADRATHRSTDPAAAARGRSGAPAARPAGCAGSGSRRSGTHAPGRRTGVAAAEPAGRPRPAPAARVPRPAAGCVHAIAAASDRWTGAAPAAARAGYERAVAESVRVSVNRPERTDAGPFAAAPATDPQQRVLRRPARAARP